MSKQSEMKKEMAAKLNEKSHIKKVIGVVSGKGGVGKSTISAMLANALKKRGLSVGVLDSDITGPSIPKAYGIKGMADGSDDGVIPMLSKGGIKVMSLNLLVENETDPVVWRGPLIANTVKQFWTDVYWGDLDVLVIDMPPGTGDVALTVFQSLPVDGIVVVTSPQQLVTMIVEKAVKMANKMDIDILGLVENMSYFKCPDCGERLEIFGPSSVEKVSKEFSIDTFAQVPMDTLLSKACDDGNIEDIDTSCLNNIVEKIINK